MHKLDHFKLFSKALALMYLFTGSSMCWNLLQDHYWISALIVATASTFFAVGHWQRLYWAFLTTVALACVVNIFSVFYFFPFFDNDTTNSSFSKSLTSFITLTFLVSSLGIYIYLNQSKMIKNSGA